VGEFGEPPVPLPESIATDPPTHIAADSDCDDDDLLGDDDDVVVLDEIEITETLDKLRSDPKIKVNDPELQPLELEEDKLSKLFEVRPRPCVQIGTVPLTSCCSCVHGRAK
jgi:hypothetical protein